MSYGLSQKTSTNRTECRWGLFPNEFPSQYSKMPNSLMNMMFTHIYILQPAVTLPIKDSVYLYPNMFRDYKIGIYNTLYK